MRRRKDKAPEPPEKQETPAEPTWKNNLNKKTVPPSKSPTEFVPSAASKKPDKPPIGTPVTTPTAPLKPKPAPPKGKPAPAAKPASSAAVEELKNELKNVREEMAKMREEFKKEISLLNSDLQSEVKRRMSLEEEVRRLRQSISS